MTPNRNLWLIGLLLIGMSSAFAQETPSETKSPNRPFRFLIGGALELGGDDVAEVYFTNGESQSVNTGQGGTLFIGGQFNVPGAEALAFRGTVGFKYLTTAADNAHIRLTRFPLNLTANYFPGKGFRLGGGISSHQGIKFNSDGIGDSFSFEPATGAVLEFAYKGIGLSYTAMKYRDDQKNEYAANAIGLTFSMTFPK